MRGSLVHVHAHAGPPTQREPAHPSDAPGRCEELQFKSFRSWLPFRSPFSTDPSSGLRHVVEVYSRKLFLVFLGRPQKADAASPSAEDGADTTCVDHTNSIIADQSQPRTVGPTCDLYPLTHRHVGLVAVKQPRFQTLGSIRESKIPSRCARLSSVRHDNVLSILGTCFLWGRTCIVSPFVQGGNLQAHLTNGSDIDRPTILLQVAHGLAFLHKNAIIHGSLHPWNVLICDKSAVLSDYSVHDVLPDPAELSFPYASSREKVVFMAPEIHRGAPYSTSTDGFSFGMLAFYVYCVPELPMQRIPGAVAVAKALMGGSRPERKEITRSDFSDAMWSLVRRCWAVRASKRPNLALVERDIAWGD